MTTRKIAVRVMWILALTLIITAISYVQPGAKVEAEVVPISELVGQTPLYPESTIVINETDGTFTLIDQSGSEILAANYTPALVGSYMDFLSNSGVSITVERSTAQSVETGMLVILGAALVLAMGVTTMLMRRDLFTSFAGRGATRRTLEPAAYRRLH